MTFQKIVLVIAIILLIISLIFIAIAMNNAKSDETWPPVIGDCPDYWVDLSGNGGACVNKMSLGTCNIPSEGNMNPMDFSQPPFTGDNSSCAKYTWARGCNVTWDGINSGVQNPCSQNDSSDS